MGIRRRVWNVSRLVWVNRNAAEIAYDNCSADWLEYGVTMRDLLGDEVIEAKKNPERRKAQLREMKGLLWAELPNTDYQPCESGLLAHRRGWALVREANQLLTGLAAA